MEPTADSPKDNQKSQEKLSLLLDLLQESTQSLSSVSRLYIYMVVLGEFKVSVAKWKLVGIEQRL